LLRKIGHIEPVARQHVALAERVDVAPARGIEPFVHLDVDHQIDVLEAAVALAVDPGIDSARDHEHPVRLTQLELHLDRFGENEPFEGLERHFVSDRHELAAAGEQPADVDLVRTIHKRVLPQHEAPPTRAGPPRTIAILRPGVAPCQTPLRRDRKAAMSIDPTASRLAGQGVAYAPQIAGAAQRYGLDPDLLAAVAAQETGGPDSNAGRNVVGDGGHGRGVFQIDDRWHSFANTPAAMDPAQNADYAAGMLSGLLKRYGGNVREALSAYNAGSPTATGTKTRWADGSDLSYADSVMRHYQRLTGEPVQSNAIAESSATIASVGALQNAAQALPPMPPLPPPPHSSHAFHRQATDYLALVNDDRDEDNS
jgi:hypothetical protein